MRAVTEREAAVTGEKFHCSTEEGSSEHEIEYN